MLSHFRDVPVLFSSSLQKVSPRFFLFSIYGNHQPAKISQRNFENLIMSKKLKKRRKVFVSDPAFCPRCGAILPLPGLEDKVSCKVCKHQQDTAGEDKVIQHGMTFEPQFLKF